MLAVADEILCRPVELILVRHAEPVRVVDSDGPADPPLSHRGEHQAALLGDYIAGQGLTAIYSSPMRRALATAAAVSRRAGRQVTVNEGLAEFDRLATSYVTLEEMRETRDERFLAMLRDDFSHYGVDMEQFRRNVVATVEAIISSHPGERVAAVCHGGVINAYIGHILDISKNSFFVPDYTSVNRVAANRSGRRSLLRLNEVTHLHGHDLLVSTV